jgi:hypothetical protein
LPNSACFVINAFSFLALLTALAIVRGDELSRSSGTVREDVWPPPCPRSYERSQIRAILAVVTVVSTVGFNFHVLVPLLAADTLPWGRRIRPLSASFGLGASSAPRRPSRPPAGARSR